MNTKVTMLIVSILGAFAGIYFIDIVKPEMNFSYWLWAFAILGAGAGNIALLIISKIYNWVKEDF